MTLTIKEFAVTVYDPEQDQTITYPCVKAVSEDHATQQAKDGYTGLLGGERIERIQAQLVVTAREV